jgi:hypothetical protein
MLASKRSFDGLRFCLNFANTCGAHGATRMWFSEELECGMSKDDNDRRTRKGDFGQELGHVDGQRYTFGCIIDKKQGTPCPHIRDPHVPYL